MESLLPLISRSHGGILWGSEGEPIQLIGTVNFNNSLVSMYALDEGTKEDK